MICRRCFNGQSVRQRNLLLKSKDTKIKWRPDWPNASSDHQTRSPTRLGGKKKTKLRTFHYQSIQGVQTSKEHLCSKSGNKFQKIFLYSIEEFVMEFLGCRFKRFLTGSKVLCVQHVTIFLLLINEMIIYIHLTHQTEPENEIEISLISYHMSISCWIFY